MFSDDSRSPTDHESEFEAPSSLVPRRHSPDPFACPCCANVFAETLRLAGVDLTAHGRGLRGHSPRAAARHLLFTNARILTMNAEAPEAESLLVSNGKIAWVGRQSDLPEALPEGTQRLDLKGKVVLPGFVEPHMHLAPLAMLRAFENIGPFRFETIASALEHLRNFALTTKPGEWIVGRQFDPSLQEGPNTLTNAMLDEISTEHPVFVYNASLHLAYCNSRALELAGVDSSTQVPAGSELERDENGAPNGVLKGGAAMALVARHNPGLRTGNLAEACLDVLSSANAVGITTVCDQGTGLFQGRRELDLYEALRASNRMTTRLRFSVSDIRAEAWDEANVTWGQGDEWVRVTGWKIVSDGSNQGRTGLQREPFLGAGLEDDNRGIAYVEVDALEDSVLKRLRAGWAVCVHANGDAAIDRVLDAFERAHEAGLDPAGHRCRIEHCSILHDEHIERLSTLGISPSFLIGHVHYWGQAFVQDIFGVDKASKLDRTGACEEKGIRWTLHSDDPVTEMNPLRCIENAVTRTMWRTDQILAPDERVPVEAAMRAMTIDAAWQCHSDHEVGSLEVGKLADFVVLGSDPREVAPTDIGKVSVEETWVQGECVWRTGGADGL
ncbi:MAG: amidohydrolase [Candidatus Binatia bacterium]|nr:amidohydrolase [Candidatus Binatia bacterium]